MHATSQGTSPSQLSHKMEAQRGANASRSRSPCDDALVHRLFSFASIPVTFPFDPFFLGKHQPSSHPTPMALTTQALLELADVCLQTGRCQELIPLYEQLEFQVNSLPAPCSLNSPLCHSCCASMLQCQECSCRCPPCCGQSHRIGVRH